MIPVLAIHREIEYNIYMNLSYRQREPERKKIFPGLHAWEKGVDLFLKPGAVCRG